MTWSTFLACAVALAIGLAVGWVAARQRTATAAAAAEAQALTDARLDASTARAEASRAREEAALAKAEVAHHLTQEANLRAALAEAGTQVAQARTATAEATAATAEALAARASAEAIRDDALKRAADLSADRETMAAQFKLLSQESLEHQGRKADQTAQERMAATQQLVTPLAEGLRQINERLTEVEKERTKLAAELREQVTAVRDSGETIRREAMMLSNALRTPQVRGSWGEHNLRRMVEISGLTARCDFDDQQTYTTSDGERFRPDMRINLADGKVVFVDSKVPLAAVLDAYNTEDKPLQDKHLDTFARHVRKHIDDLSGKAYWQLDLGSPEFVVLFLGSDEFYRLAQERMPDLHEYAARRNIMLACPGTLIPMLHIVAHGWKQAALAESAAEVSKLGRDLYDRLATMGEHFDKLGNSINSTVTNFNKAVATLESRVMVSARRFKDFAVGDKPLPTRAPIESRPREVSVPEMLDYQENRQAELGLFQNDAGTDVDHASVRQLPRRTGTT